MGLLLERFTQGGCDDVLDTQASLNRDNDIVLLNVRVHVHVHACYGTEYFFATEHLQLLHAYM